MKIKINSRGKTTSKIKNEKDIKKATSKRKMILKMTLKKLSFTGLSHAAMVYGIYLFIY